MAERVELTKSEAESIREYIECTLPQYIREDPDWDSLLWLDNLTSIWRKCGGRETFADGGGS